MIAQFIKFGIVGLSNTLIAYLVYAAFAVSVLNAYYWSDRYVFKKGAGESRSAVKTLLKTYIAYGCTGLLLASILLWLYVDQLHISEYIAQLLVLVVTIPLNFIINSRGTRQKPPSIRLRTCVYRQ